MMTNEEIETAIKAIKSLRLHIPKTITPIKPSFNGSNVDMTQFTLFAKDFGNVLPYFKERHFEDCLS